MAAWAEESPLFLLQMLILNRTVPVVAAADQETKAKAKEMPAAQEEPMDRTAAELLRMPLTAALAEKREAAQEDTDKKDLRVIEAATRLITAAAVAAVDSTKTVRERSQEDTPEQDTKA